MARWLTAALPMACVSRLGLATRGPEEPGVPERPLLLVHYMPWYASKEQAGGWGWHWTMDHFDPDQFDPASGGHLASHYEPLVGPYDSGDPLLIDYHLQLMKIAGIDGVVIDWYGTSSSLDYPLLHRNAQRMIESIRRASMRYAICYEDQSLRQVQPGGPEEIQRQAFLDLRWWEETCMEDRAYVRVDGRPVLLVFGPQQLSADLWRTWSDRLPVRPRLFGLPHLVTDRGMDHAYGWPPVTGGMEIPPRVWGEYLDALHRDPQAIGCIFPGFHDIYQQAGVHASYGSIDERDGRTFQETVDRALRSHRRLIQVATWNDFGEGTMIEPTRQRQYRDLEVLRQRNIAGTAGSALDLALPLLLYQSRLEDRRGGSKKAEALNEVASHLLMGRYREARERLQTTVEG